MPRLAIVIGVNKPKAPAPLKGAVEDAKKFAKWIGRQGFDVKPFIDDAAPVTFAAIFDEVERAVEARTYSQIVLYFAGHGLQNGGSEIWLLSGAPNNPNEAISVEVSVMAARESGLESVVFISDACRSIPAGMQFSRVDGGSIFPNKPLDRNTRPEIDRVFATLPSLVAVEAALADDTARREGIFTREFMNGFLDPPDALIERVSENGQSIEVVTNRKLKERLRDLVENAAFTEMPKAGQLPEFILESVQAYVGRVERAPKDTEFKFALPGGLKTNEFLPDTRRGPPRRRRPSAPSVTAVAQRAINLAREVQGTAQAAAAAAQQIDPNLGLAQTINLFSADVPVKSFETQTGFSVTGAKVRGANSPNFPAETLGQEFVRLWPIGAASASVLIEFDNGNGTVLPGLRGYIGHIFVDNGVVINVNYVPSTNSERWVEYTKVREQIEGLRAAVAAAAGLGVFRISPDEAPSFADKIRYLKAYDPTLGLYAAYAYASAGLDEDIRSVQEYMREDLKTELFDVAMLAERGVSPRETGPQTILPFCPMLRQGWSFVAVRDARLSEVVLAARDWLLPALWTTFAPEGVRLLRDAITGGNFR
jgi:Caspase domain